MINNQNEIVIISVTSDINELNAFIKKKLSYKKVDVRGMKNEKSIKYL